MGFCGALFAGVLFGSNFDPPTVIEQKPGHSDDPLNYVFSHFTGILATAMVSLIVYVLVMRRKSFIRCEIVLPAMLSGAIWGVAQTAWFKANTALSFVIAFPIITTVPGLIAMVWGVLLFREFKMPKARVFVLAAVLVQIPGVLLIAMSKS